MVIPDEGHYDLPVGFSNCLDCVGDMHGGGYPGVHARNGVHRLRSGQRMAPGDLIPKMRYEDARPFMQTGDVILWKGNGAVSKIIRKFSDDWSHASFVVRMENYEGLKNSVFLVEALADRGVVPRQLSLRLLEYDGEAWWFKPDGINAHERDICHTAAIMACSEGYAYDGGSVLKNLLGRVSIDAKRLFCSEAVWWIWRESGFVTGNVAPRPGDIPKWVKGTLTPLIPPENK